MRFGVASRTLLALGAGLPFTTAIFVAPSSSCAVQCGNVLDSTSVSDIVCGDGSYTSQTGQTFQNCVSCELSSSYVDPVSKISDLQAAMYNLRFLSSYCLFNGSLATTQCITGFACGYLEGSLEYEEGQTNASAFGYCSTWQDYRIPQCEACLNEEPGETYQSNFLTALDVGCSQLPTPGQTLSLNGSVFSTTPVAASTPSLNVPVPVIVHGPLPLNTIMGIVFGSLVGILVVVGIAIIWRGKRRRRAILAKHARAFEAQYGSPPSAFYDMKEHSPQSAISQQALIAQNLPWGGGDRKFSEGSQHSLMDKSYFSPYVSPVSPDAAQRWQHGFMDDQLQSAGVSSPSAGKDNEEAYEMQRLRERDASALGFVPAPAPIIRHPANGRANIGNVGNGI